MRTATIVLAISILVLASSGCSQPTPGPDKTAAGAVLGAGWGTGAGAIIGNQIGAVGGGAAVGAGLGAIEGILVGAGYDVLESHTIRQQEELASLRVQNISNRQQLESLQHQLDRANFDGVASGVYQVNFDADAVTLRSGSIANLEIVAEQARNSVGNPVINVVGHSDDAGTPEYNQRIAEARARAVAAYLAQRGISINQIKISHYGSERPISSNATPEGRQLNRRVDIFFSKE